MAKSEIDDGLGYLGYKEALELILSNISAIKTEVLSLYSAAGCVSSEDVVALVDSPTSNISIKDGFAVNIHDLGNASDKDPVKLVLVGSIFAGERFDGRVEKGQTVRVCSGSTIPAGADAVVSTELVEEVGSVVYFKASETTGQNIINAGEDVGKGALILQKGTVLLPVRLGLLAAGGIHRLKVFAKPKTAIIAIGDEIVVPGESLKDGQVYASNMVNIAAWLSSFNVPYSMTTAADDVKVIQRELISQSDADVIITSGSAWESERDLIVKVLDDLGWKRLFRHVRMGPGKGTSFGIWKNKPVFCLPGGPSSNETAFLQLALPGLLHMAGLTGYPLQSTQAKLTQDVVGRNLGWTEFHKATMSLDGEGNRSVMPYSGARRLQSMADQICFVCKPEGAEVLRRGQTIMVQVMVPSFGGLSINP
jgi:molybdopterin molybdotransferase